MKLVKNLAMLSAAVAVMGSFVTVVSADQSATSKGTLQIEDGTLTLDKVDDLDFGTIAYNANGFSLELPTTGNKATLVDTTVAQGKWKIQGSTDSQVATLTVNGMNLSATAGTVFSGDSASSTFAKTQEVSVDPSNTLMAMTGDQAKANKANAVSMDIDWTLSADASSRSFN
ncbi:hypothetical protein H9L19_03570 [Weissella diestrammenae]|uniref:WxL domain-containing protein n=1 Tax=Weissella diestrammenae TaxID=1162633 RepID=A0A7G9T771_9LACO|nr:hypothetical protein [Weissella diestrammenae]MCM0582452.1 hypothetical protein [Weissella diestrammenae]QNN75946.1 hypothetical protein H9L19_03570 [Weissella diestrammenae]